MLAGNRKVRAGGRLDAVDELASIFVPLRDTRVVDERKRSKVGPLLRRPKTKETPASKRKSDKQVQTPKLLRKLQVDQEKAQVGDQVGERIARPGPHQGDYGVDQEHRTSPASASLPGPGTRRPQDHAAPNTACWW